MNKLKELRKAKGVTQKQVCEKIGISQPSLANAENGKKNLSTANLIKLSRFFEVKIDFLISGDFIKNPILKPQIIKQDCFKCPKCDNILSILPQKQYRYCNRCGTKLDWSIL